MKHLSIKKSEFGFILDGNDTTSVPSPKPQTFPGERSNGFVAEKWAFQQASALILPLMPLRMGHLRAMIGHRNRDDAAFWWKGLARQ